MELTNNNITHKKGDGSIMENEVRFLNDGFDVAVDVDELDARLNAERLETRLELGGCLFRGGTGCPSDCVAQWD